MEFITTFAMMLKVYKFGTSTLAIVILELDLRSYAREW